MRPRLTVWTTMLLTACNLGGGGKDDTDPLNDTDGAMDTDVAVDTDLHSVCPEAGPFCHQVEGLLWTDLSNTEHLGVNWEQARTNCEGLGGRLPTITELRRLVRTCPDTEDGGACLVTESCRDVATCGAVCAGCASADDGRYSVFGDVDVMWSDTQAEYSIPYQSWRVHFQYAMVTFSDQAGSGVYRCVQ